MRAIDADALTKKLGINKDCEECEFNNTPLCEWRPNPVDICEAIEEAPTIEPESHWIPCSERLPDEYGEYRITWVTSCAPSKRFIGDSEYEMTTVWDDKRLTFKGEWLLNTYIKVYPDVKVIAWKPLEEPYGGDEDASN